MVGYVRFPVGDGATIVVETALDGRGTGPVGAGDMVEKAAETLEIALAQTSAVIEALRHQMEERLADAKEVTVEFGVKLSGELGAIIAKSNAEANFKISVKWER